MNLIKNVTGDWEKSKQQLRADLDTIQRQVNAILAQINAPSTASPDLNAILSAANTVTTFSAEFLRSVAVAPGSGLTGNGTITSPLGFNGSSALISKTFVITIAQMQTLHSVPAILVPGIVGQVIQPVSVGFHTAQSTQFASNVSGTIRFDTIATDYTGTMTTVMGGLTPGVQVDFWAWAMMPNIAGALQQSTLGNPPEEGKGIVLRGSIDSAIGPVQPGRTQITGAIAYYLV